MASGLSCQTTVEIVIDESKLDDAINDAPRLSSVLENATNQIVNNANALSAGYRTGIWHAHADDEEKGVKKGDRLGNTQPKYVGDVKRKKHGPVGIVHPKSYAAMKDNYEHNTMLKSVGGIHV